MEVLAILRFLKASLFELLNGCQFGLKHEIRNVRGVPIILVKGATMLLGVKGLEYDVSASKGSLFRKLGFLIADLPTHPLESIHILNNIGVGHSERFEPGGHLACGMK